MIIYGIFCFTCVFVCRVVDQWFSENGEKRRWGDGEMRKVED